MKIFGRTFFERTEPKGSAGANPNRRINLGGKQQTRRFDAGFTDRLVSKWTVADQTVNMALLRDLRTMRARSRDFARNNEYGRKFFRLVKTNVVGHAGFTLKVDCRQSDGTVDKKDSELIRSAWLRFAKRGQYDVTGQLSEVLFDQLVMSMIARDGEVLIRKVEGRNHGIHNCQLQVLSAHLLDEEHNRDLANGNRIRMGVEFDGWMKPVAYHLRDEPKNADMQGSASRKYTRVSASEIEHLFLPEEIDQWRGTPWVFAALRGAKHLDQFDESALVAANIGAAKMGFFQQRDPDAGLPMGVDEDETQDDIARDEFTTEVSPGQFDVVPEGYEFKGWDPGYPNEVYEPFRKAVLHRITAGLDTSYHSVSGDLRDVNFSSIRHGTLDEREAWKMLQSWYIEDFKAPIFEWWLARAMVTDPALRGLPFTKFDKFNAPVFFGRRWDWIDPKADVVADREAVALGTKSRAQIIRERGRDPDEVWSELEEEERRGFKQPQQPNQPVADDDPPEDPKKD